MLVNGCSAMEGFIAIEHPPLAIVDLPGDSQSYVRRNLEEEIDFSNNIPDF